MKRTTRTPSGRHSFALALASLIAAMPLAAMAKPALDRASPAAPAFDQAAPPVTPKPTPPIAITHRLEGQLQVGQPVEVILSIAAEGDMTGVNVRFDAEDPLAMIDPADPLGIGELRAGEGADVAVTVLPLLDRTHYLNVTVTALIDGTLQTRSIAVPIRLPGAEVRKSDSEATGAGDDAVRSFRAIETVR